MLHDGVICDVCLALCDTVLCIRLQRAAEGNAAPGSHMSHYIDNNTETCHDVDRHVFSEILSTLS